MKRIEALKSIAGRLDKEIVVSNLGYTSRELYQVCDRSRNFYMLGSMGLASSIGLGLALARESEKVVVIDGDGSILMNLGSLVTIAHEKPENLILLVLDNESYGTTGGQPSYTSSGTSVANLAKASSIGNVQCLRRRRDLEKFLDAALAQKGPSVGVVKIEGGNALVPQITLSPERIKTRFMEAITHF